LRRIPPLPLRVSLCERGRGYQIGPYGFRFANEVNFIRSQSLCEEAPPSLRETRRGQSLLSRSEEDSESPNALLSLRECTGGVRGKKQLIRESERGFKIFVNYVIKKNFHNKIIKFLYY